MEWIEKVRKQSSWDKWFIIERHRYQLLLLLLLHIFYETYLVLNEMHSYRYFNTEIQSEVGLSSPYLLIKIWDLNIFIFILNKMISFYFINGKF